MMSIVSSEIGALIRPSVRADQHERDGLGRGRQVLEPQSVLAGLGAVEQAEAVLALLHVEVRPDLAVDDDPVALEGVLEVGL